jgi:hypothetical protein
MSARGRGKESFGLGMQFATPPTGRQLVAGLWATTRELGIQGALPKFQSPRVLTADNEPHYITYDGDEVVFSGPLGDDEPIISLRVTNTSKHLEDVGLFSPGEIEIAPGSTKYISLASQVGQVVVRSIHHRERSPGYPGFVGEYDLLNASLHDVHGALNRAMVEYDPSFFGQE